MRRVKRLLVSAEIRFDQIPTPTDEQMEAARQTVLNNLLTAAAEQGLWGDRNLNRLQQVEHFPGWTSDDIKVEVDEVEVW